jgi:hypothetical protein
MAKTALINPRLRGKYFENQKKAKKRRPLTRADSGNPRNWVPKSSDFAINQCEHGKN